MGLPERLIALRKKAKISQKELAEEIDVSQASIGYWERGQRTPSIDAVQKIAKYFNVTTDYLLGLTGDNTVNMDGLTEKEIAHIKLLIADLLNR